jgi:hypothetical protein
MKYRDQRVVVLSRALSSTSSSTTAFLGEQIGSEAAWIQSVELDLTNISMLEVLILALPSASSKVKFILFTPQFYKIYAICLYFSPLTVIDRHSDSMQRYC